MSINEQLKAMNDFINSEKGKQYMLDYFDSLKRLKQHEDRWTDRMYNRIKDNIDESIEHLDKWYSSDKYRDREYKMGIEPRERLFWVLSDVAEKYGRECTEQEMDIYANMFTGSMFVIGSYVIQVMHGQGSVIRIDKMC
jgi:hypothetical protein